MTKLYIVMLQDKHADPKGGIYTDLKVAKKLARRIAKKNCKFKDQYEELKCDGKDGIMFYCIYSSYGDSVSVIKAELDEEL